MMRRKGFEKKKYGNWQTKELQQQMMMVFLSNADNNITYLSVSSVETRSELVKTERERDQALKAVGELSSRTDSLEEQLERLGRLLKDAQDRASEKARQLQDAEVSPSCFFCCIVFARSVSPPVGGDSITNEGRARRRCIRYLLHLVPPACRKGQAIGDREQPRHNIILI